MSAWDWIHVSLFHYQPWMIFEDQISFEFVSFICDCMHIVDVIYGDFLLNRLAGNNINQLEEEYQLAKHGLILFHSLVVKTYLTFVLTFSVQFLF